MGLDCEAALEQLADYLDADARAELCQAIEEHLRRCRDCRVFVDTVMKTIVLYQNGAPVPLPPRASALLSAALAREYQTARGDPRLD